MSRRCLLVVSITVLAVAAPKGLMLLLLLLCVGPVVLRPVERSKGDGGMNLSMKGDRQDVVWH